MLQTIIDFFQYLSTTGWHRFAAIVFTAFAASAFGAGYEITYRRAREAAKAQTDRNYAIFTEWQATVSMAFTTANTIPTSLAAFAAPRVTRPANFSESSAERIASLEVIDDDHFVRIATELSAEVKGLWTLALVCGGVFSQMYPPRSTLYHIDMIAYGGAPLYNQLATNKVSYAEGPISYNYLNFSYGINVHVPIYTSINKTRESFWGTSIVIFTAADVVGGMGLPAGLAADGMVYVLWIVDTSTVPSNSVATTGGFGKETTVMSSISSATVDEAYVKSNGLRMRVPTADAWIHTYIAICPAGGLHSGAPSGSDWGYTVLGLLLSGGTATLLLYCCLYAHFMFRHRYAPSSVDKSGSGRRQRAKKDAAHHHHPIIGAHHQTDHQTAGKSVEGGVVSSLSTNNHQLNSKSIHVVGGDKSTIGTGGTSTLGRPVAVTSTSARHQLQSHVFIAAVTLRGAEPVMEHAPEEGAKLLHFFNHKVRAIAAAHKCYVVSAIGDRCVYVVSSDAGNLAVFAKAVVSGTAVRGNTRDEADVDGLDGDEDDDEDGGADGEKGTEMKLTRDSSSVAVIVADTQTNLTNRSGLMNTTNRMNSFHTDHTAHTTITTNTGASRTGDGKTTTATTMTSTSQASSFIARVVCYASATLHCVPAAMFPRFYDRERDCYFYGTSAALSRLCSAVDKTEAGEVGWTSAFEEWSNAESKSRHSPQPSSSSPSVGLTSLSSPSVTAMLLRDSLLFTPASLGSHKFSKRGLGRTRSLNIGSGGGDDHRRASSTVRSQHHSGRQQQYSVRSGHHTNNDTTDDEDEGDVASSSLGMPSAASTNHHLPVPRTVEEGSRVIIYAVPMRRTIDDERSNEDAPVAMALLTDKYMALCLGIIAKITGDLRRKKHRRRKGTRSKQRTTENNNRKRTTDGEDSHSSDSDSSDDDSGGDSSHNSSKDAVEITTTVRSATLLHITIGGGTDVRSVLPTIRRIIAKERGALVSAHDNHIVAAFNLLGAGGHHQVRAVEAVLHLRAALNPLTHPFVCSIHCGKVTALISTSSAANSGGGGGNGAGNGGGTHGHGAAAMGSATDGMVMCTGEVAFTGRLLAMKALALAVGGACIGPQPSAPALPAAGGVRPSLAHCIVSGTYDYIEESSNKKTSFQDSSCTPTSAVSSNTNLMKRSVRGALVPPPPALNNSLRGAIPFAFPPPSSASIVGGGGLSSSVVVVTHHHNNTVVPTTARAGGVAGGSSLLLPSSHQQPLLPQPQQRTAMGHGLCLLYCYNDVSSLYECEAIDVVGSGDAVAGGSPSAAAERPHDHIHHHHHNHTHHHSDPHGRVLYRLCGTKGGLSSYAVAAEAAGAKGKGGGRTTTHNTTNRGGGVTRTAGAASAFDEEWMYQLKEAEDSSPFTAINGAFAKVCGGDVAGAKALWEEGQQRMQQRQQQQQVAAVKDDHHPSSTVSELIDDAKKENAEAPSPAEDPHLVVSPYATARLLSLIATGLHAAMPYCDAEEGGDSEPMAFGKEGPTRTMVITVAPPSSSTTPTAALLRLGGDEGVSPPQQQQQSTMNIVPSDAE